MKADELVHGRYYRLTLVPKGVNGVFLQDARVRHVAANGEHHFILDDKRFQAQTIQWKLADDNASLLKFNFNGSWTGDGNTIADSLAEDRS